MKFLFVSGPHAVGKSYTMSKLAKDLNMTLYDTGPIMREYHKKLAPDKSMGEWVTGLEAKHGKKVTAFMLAKKLKDKMKEENTSGVIIVGFRTGEGIFQFMDIMKSNDFGVLYVDGTMELLYENYNRRLQSTTNQRKDAVKTYEEFEYYINEELASGLSEIRDCALSGAPMTYYFKKEDNGDGLYHYARQILEQSKEKPKTEVEGEPSAPGVN